MAHPLASILLLSALSAGTMYSQLRLQDVDSAVRESTRGNEALYLPNGTALRAITLGYDHVVADMLWFKTISYFGKHYAADKNYTWLFHMCDLVTTLSPKAKHVYTFGATMLAWEGHAAVKSMQLLDKAIANIPGDWYLHYLRGFTAMYFLQDRARAKDDFVTAAKLPGAHVIVQRLAARELTQGNDPSEAVLFLSDLLRTTRDPIAQTALRERLKEAKEELQRRRNTP